MRAPKHPRLPLWLLPLFLISLPALGAAPEALLPAQLGVQRITWEKVEATQLERVAGDQAALLREYGARRAEQAVYGDPPLLLRIRLTVYIMQDRSGAYGAFTLLREKVKPVEVVEVGEAGVFYRLGNDPRTLFRFMFYQGNYLVMTEGLIERHGTGTREWLRRVARHLAEAGREQPSLPTLPRYLPREGFVEGSDRYLLGPLALGEVAPLAPGDWAGFAYGAEAGAGRYRLGRAEATLLLFSYPTPQIAADRLRDFERLFNLNGTGDPARPLAFAKRSGTLVVFVSGVTSGQDAATLLNRVRYETEISWSETSPPQPEPHWTVTMVNLFLGTGLFVVYAFLSAVAFGAVRVLIQRLLPGRVFDRPEDTEIIRLDLSLKR